MGRSMSKELSKDSLGLSESVIMGVAGTAPAFSIAATTGALIATVGTLATASIFYCGLIMFGITLAFLHLNRIKTNAGASYAWVGDIFHPVLGFLAGWALLVASAVFMVSGTIPAATGLLAFIYPEGTMSPVIVAFTAGCVLVLVGLIVIKGVKLASFVQTLLTVIEVGILVAVIIGIFIQFYSSPVRAVNWNELSLTAFTPETFALGALTGLFFFWGWDVTLNLSEETEKADKNPGKGAVLAMLITLLLFMSFTVAAQLSLSQTEIKDAGTNIIYVLSEKIFPHPYSYLAVVAVLLSTLGTLETTILQFTRTMFAKGRDGVLHPRYAVLHKKWKTPLLATILIVSIGLFLLFLSSFSPTVNRIIEVSVKAIGFQVALYYGLTGFACAWHFRKEARESVGKFVTLFLWPLFSATFLVLIGIYSALKFDLLTTMIGVGGILVGVIPLLLNKRRVMKGR